MSNWIYFDSLWVDGWSYPSLFLVILSAFIFSFWASDFHKISAQIQIYQSISRIFDFFILFSVFVISYWFWVDSPYYDGKHLMTFYGLWVLFFFIFDRVYVHLLRKFNIHQNLKTIVIVDREDDIHFLKNYIDTNPWLGFKVLKILPVFQKEDIFQLAEEFTIDKVLFNVDLVSFELEFKDKLRKLSENKLVKMYGFSELYSSKVKRGLFELIDKTPIISLFDYPLDYASNQFIKRYFDIFFALFMLVFFLSWLMPILSILIYFQNRGPIFYRHERIGLNNKSFRCWKLRTMYQSKESEPFQQTIKNDARILPVGHFIRKNNIDELPQFINVLLGDMSVVGPRPMMIGHIKEYDLEIAEMYSRHMIKPGVTGLAQVSGYRGEIDSVQKMNGRIRLDRFYIHNWTFILDLKIIWWTIRNMIFGDEQAI
ncbi:MAG: exopolysaccharide biosynthesis polyprenyl glycosylphosphotransferase [Chitinophagales bacterium]|nr:exopolysaccharide biosynthesis polyprenyl glycosylphosphotransferase [Chitinophagales bacterium]